MSENARIATLTRLRTLAESVRNLAVVAVQHHIHNEFAAGHLTVTDLADLQQEWNGIEDHLDAFIDLATSKLTESIDSAHADRISLDMTNTPTVTLTSADITFDDQPDPDGDRDYPGPTGCPTCHHDLELNADLRCSRCGS